MNRPSVTFWTVTSALTFLMIVPSAESQSLFDGHEVLQVSIEAPLKTLQKVRSDEDYLDGKFVYTDEAGSVQAFDLKLRTRGRYRLRKSTCPFPPIRLNFRTGQVEDSILDGQDKLKLVTHCNNRRSQNEQYVLREYLAYRILQTLTDKSFSARLLRIDYVDTENERASMTKYGFVIEDDENLAERINMAALGTQSLRHSDLDKQHANLVNLYQFLIGNTDFSLIRGPADDDCCHNSVLFAEDSNIFAIPYDFDFSGLVDAPYADPNPKFKISSVRSRLYRGRCSNNHLLPDTIAYFESKKAEIFGLVEELTDLDDKNRKKVIRFLEDFYKVVSTEKTMQRKLFNGCS